MLLKNEKIYQSGTPKSTPPQNLQKFCKNIRIDIKAKSPAIC